MLIFSDYRRMAKHQGFFLQSRDSQPTEDTQVAIQRCDKNKKWRQSASSKNVYSVNSARLHLHSAENINSEYVSRQELEIMNFRQWKDIASALSQKLRLIRYRPTGYSYTFIKEAIASYI